MKYFCWLNYYWIEKYEGVVPADFEALESFPAVGHKTASVVMSQAFGYPAFAVDTHVHRLMYRWGLSNGKSVVQTEIMSIISPIQPKILSPIKG